MWSFKEDQLMCEKITKDIELAKLYVLEAKSLTEQYKAERTEEIKMNMCYLGSKIITLTEELEKEIDFTTFIKIFELNETDDENNEVDRDSNFIDNLIANCGAVGKVVRTRLIRAENLIKEMVND